MSSFKGKIFAIFTVLMMIASATCVIAGSEGGNTTNHDNTITLSNVTIGKADFKNSFGGNGDSWYEWNDSDNIGTLHLNNFSFKTTASKGIVFSVDIIIDVVGECEITVESENPTVIESEHNNIEITGKSDSSLTLSTGTSTKMNRAIYTYSSTANESIVKISGGLTVNALTDSAQSTNITTIYGRDVIIKDSTLNIRNGDATGNRASSYAIRSYNDVTISNSIVDIEMGHSTNTSTAIYPNESLSITGTKTKLIVRADGIQSDSASSSSSIDFSYAIRVNNMTVQDAFLDLAPGNVTGSKTFVYSQGINANTVSFSNAIIYANAGNVYSTDTTGESVGINCKNTSASSTITGSTIYATGGIVDVATSKVSKGIVSKSGTNQTTLTNCVLGEVSGHAASVSTNVEIDDASLALMEGSVQLDPLVFETITPPLDNYRIIRTTVKTVTYDCDDGKGTKITESRSVGEKFISPECEVTKEGFTFSGWSDGTTTYAVGDVITMGSADMTLTAVWETVTTKYTVTFDSGSPDVPAPQAQVVPEGQKATEPEVSWTNHILTGWYDKDGNVWNFQSNVTANMTLTAHWMVVSEKMTLDTDSAGKVEISIPQDAGVKEITIKNGNMQVNIPEESVNAIKEAQRNMYVTVTEINVVTANAIASSSNGGSESVFLVTMKYDDNEDFIGKRTIALPYYPEQGSDFDVYLREGSKDTLVESTLYTPENVITIEVDHGATYVVKYTEAPEPTPSSGSDSSWPLLAAFIIAILAVAYVGIVSRNG